MAGYCCPFRRGWGVGMRPWADGRRMWWVEEGYMWGEPFTPPGPRCRACILISLGGCCWTN